MKKNWLSKTLVIGVVVLFIGISVMPITGSLVLKKQVSTNNKTSYIMGNSRGNTLYVGGSGPNNYTKIQDAINDTNEGDTVFVYDDSSPYYENVYVKDKSINVIGENTDTTVIDGRSGEYEWAFLADNAHGSTVSDLTLQNVTTIYGTNFAFMAMHSDNMKIINCCIRDSINGMRLFYSANTFMRNNSFENNTMPFDISGWSQASDFYNDIDTSNTINGKPMYNLVNKSDLVLDGIDIGWLGLINCTNIIVKNITITDNGVNILFIDTKNSTVSNCILYNSSQKGIYIGFDSYNNVIENCQMIDGIKFISSIYTDEPVPKNNTVSNCNLTSGISFQKSDYNFITNCNINLTLEKTGMLGFCAFVDSSYNTISNCKIYNTKNTNFGVGCVLQHMDTEDLGCHYNKFINNTISNFFEIGIQIRQQCTNNEIIGNRINNCGRTSGAGIYILSNDENNNNKIYNNTFIDNYRNGYSAGNNNYWNGSYPTGGNYWDDYNGVDIYRGPNQDIPSSDCIVDTPNNIPGNGNNKDQYPLKYEWGENPPVADFTYKVDNYTAFFNASSSYDLDGTVVSYYWEFGDDTNGTGMLISHTYSENKTYEVELTVTADDGKQGIFPKWTRIGNQAPWIPWNPDPENGSTSVDVNDGISWECGDPDEDPIKYNVYFEADDPTPDVLVSENQTLSTYDPGKMNYSTDYYWQIEVWDIFGASTFGPVWNFTTEKNAPPYKPRDPEPPNGATDVNVNADLSWECGDPDEDPIKYNVYFEADDPTPDVLVSENQTLSTYDPGKMNYSTDYYWQIEVLDHLGLSRTGPVWNFTTSSKPNDPPYPPSNPDPLDGATDVDIDADLSWDCSDPDGDSIVYDIYLEADDSTPDILVADDYSETTFDPGTLEFGKIYYWKIIAIDEHGASKVGPIWHFTTEENMPPDAPSIDGPLSGKPGIEYNYVFSAVDPDGDDVKYHVDWGDDTFDVTGFNPSGMNITVPHTWIKSGKYKITAYAEDVYGYAGLTSTFQVTMPRNKAVTSNMLLLRILERFPLLQRLLNVWRSFIE